jgi:hypothetical protein
LKKKQCTNRTSAFKFQIATVLEFNVILLFTRDLGTFLAGTELCEAEAPAEAFELEEGDSTFEPSDPFGISFDLALLEPDFSDYKRNKSQDTKNKNGNWKNPK